MILNAQNGGKKQEEWELEMFLRCVALLLRDATLAERRRRSVRRKWWNACGSWYLAPNLESDNNNHGCCSPNKDKDVRWLQDAGPHPATVSLGGAAAVWRRSVRSWREHVNMQRSAHDGGMLWATASCQHQAGCGCLSIIMLQEFFSNYR